MWNNDRYYLEQWHVENTLLPQYEVSHEAKREKHSDLNFDEGKVVMQHESVSQVYRL